MFKLALNEKLLNDNVAIEEEIFEIKKLIDCTKINENDILIPKLNFLVALLYGILRNDEKMQNYISISYEILDEYSLIDHKFLSRLYLWSSILGLKDNDIEKSNLYREKFNCIYKNGDLSVEVIILKMQLIYINSSKCISSSVIIKEIEDLYVMTEKIDDFECKKMYFFMVGKIYLLFLDDALMAKMNFIKAMKFADALNDEEVSSLCNIRLGECECIFENYEDAKDYFNEVINNKKYKKMNIIHKYRASNYITNILIKTKDYSGAIHNISKSEVYLEKIEDKKIKELEKFSLYTSLAIYYAMSNEKILEKSLSYLNEARELLKYINNAEDYLIYDLEVAYYKVNVCYVFENYENALLLSRELLEKAKNAKNYAYVKESYKIIYLCFEAMHEYELSMKYFKMYYELKQIYMKTRNRNYIDSLNYRHEYIEKEINDMKKVKIDLNKKKYIDALTGTYNRAYLNDILKKEKANEYSTIFMIDVDYFKDYNDTHGHYNGDIALKNISKVIKNYLKEDMSIIRYGGEEFLILSTYKEFAKSKSFGKKLCKVVKKFLNNDLTISVGIDTCKDSSINIIKIIENADVALYNAKKSGRNRCLHYHDIKNFNC